MHYVAPDPDGVTLRPVTTINCSYRGLVELPDKLPSVTTTLLVKGNQVLAFILVYVILQLTNNTVICSKTYIRGLPDTLKYPVESEKFQIETVATVAMFVFYYMHF
jgi:hypothetical protein